MNCFNIIIIFVILIIVILINKRECLTNTPNFYQSIQLNQKINLNLDINRTRSQDHIGTKRNILSTKNEFEIGNPIRMTQEFRRQIAKAEKKVNKYKDKLKQSSNNKCGPLNGNKRCADTQCCSSEGWCCGLIGTYSGCCSENNGESGWFSGKFDGKILNPNLVY